MMHLNELKQEFKKLTHLSKHKRMLELCALLTDYFQENEMKPVVVGGLSVEIYTRNNYTTQDIDIITDGREQFDKLLTRELGFIKEGRSWYNKELELSIEIPDNYLDGSYDKVISMQLESGRNIFVIGIEDIIIHRLESAMISHKENPEWSDDYDWAKRMFEIHKFDRDLIDLDYLQHASSDIDVIKIVKNWMDENDV
ncbi:hypothetical protein LG329_06005 [Virgibacillus necropolis]|uniref:hypothetical protein n=1 Tax=Virgibacillus necropolis TaxID=163877 RepID=UPI00384DFC95